MAGSSIYRSTPFPVPVYIYWSFIDPKFTGTSTGTGTGTQGFKVSLSWSWSDLIHGTIVPLVLRSNIDILADLSWLLCMICHAWILRSRIQVSGSDGSDSSANRNFQIACMKIDWPDSINHLQQSALTSPGLDFCPPSTTLVFIGGIM